MGRPTHYFFVHHKTNKKARKKQSRKLTAFDNFVLTLSFLYPLSGVPQVLAVWNGNGEVAVLTWLLFLVFGFVSLAYGIIHDIKPMIVGNIIWTVVDLAVIIGVLKN